MSRKAVFMLVGSLKLCTLLMGKYGLVFSATFVGISCSKGALGPTHGKW